MRKLSIVVNKYFFDSKLCLSYVRINCLVRSYYVTYLRKQLHNHNFTRLQNKALIVFDVIHSQVYIHI